jgi:diketogulonate reductase-like aldo/keto reductase
LATASRALSNAQEGNEQSRVHDIGEGVITLEHGLSALRVVYDAFDVGIRELRT